MFLANNSLNFSYSDNKVSSIAILLHIFISKGTAPCKAICSYLAGLRLLKKLMIFKKSKILSDKYYCIPY